MNLDDSQAVAQLQALAETTPDALVTIDTKSRIQFVNPAIEDVLGYEPEELRGESLTTLMPEDLEGQHLQAVDRYLTTGVRELDWNHIELPGLHRDGHQVPLEITFSEVSIDGDRYFTGVIRDISNRKTLESERDLLQTAKSEVTQTAEFPEALRNALGLVGESMNWVYGEAWLPGESSDLLVPDAAWESDDRDLGAFRERSMGTTCEPGDGLVGRVWESGEYEWTPDVTADGSEFERSESAGQAGLKAALGVPIHVDEAVAGVVVFLMAEERTVDERMVEMTRTVAASLGLLLARKRAEDALRAERNLFSNVLETTPAGLVVIDADGEFTYANHRAEEVLRLDPDDGGYPTFEELPFRTLDEEGAVLPESERPYHAVLRSGTDVSRDVQIEYPDGDRRWLAVSGTALRDDSGTVTRSLLAFEDITDRKRRENTLEQLNEFGRELAEVETFEAACERAATAARDIVGLSITSVERYDAETGQLEPCARTDRAEGRFGEAPLFGPESDLVWDAFVGNEPRVTSDLAESDEFDDSQTPLASAIVLPIAEHGVLICGEIEPDAFSDTSVTLARLLVENVRAAFDRLEREVELREQKTELERKNERLRRVQRVNDQTREITEALMEATSEAEIKRVVCERLANSDPYRFVWFGERDIATDGVVATASAGVEEGYLDEIEVTADTSETGLGPAERAVRTREVQLQNDLQSDPPFEPWRQAAMQRGYRASIAVPVVYNDTLYGLLNLYANEPDVFTDMEEAVLTELGGMVGYALNAMERYDALVSEESVELEFLIEDFSNPLLELLEEQDASARLENIGARKAGSLQVFVAFDGVAVETLRDFFENRLGTDELTLVRDHDEEIIVELSLPEETFLVTLIERGAMPTAISASPAGGRTTIRIPKSTSVREFVEVFDERYDDAELVARRESPEPVRTKEEFERAYVDRLTERQQEVLQTAYFAGFFEQPRENTARDVAEMLGVSQPTVSRHIRSSQQTLFSMLFDDGGTR